MKNRNLANLSMFLFLTSLSLSVSVSVNIICESGNWYEKLYWWKKAQPTFEEVHTSLGNIKKAAKKLLQEKSSLDNIISDFYAQIGYSAEEFKHLIADENSKLKQEHQELEEIYTDLDLSDHDQESSEEQEELIDLENNIKIISNITEKLNLLDLLEANTNEALLDILQEQIQLAEHYEDRAAEDFDKIEQVLDDKKARILYEDIENSRDNNNAIADYISNKLANYISSNIKNINNITAEIMSNIKDLEAKQILLRKLSDQEIEARKQEQEQLAKELKEKRAKALADQEAKLSWWQRIWRWLKSFF